MVWCVERLINWELFVVGRYFLIMFVSVDFFNVFFLLVKCLWWEIMFYRNCVEVVFFKKFF